MIGAALRYGFDMPYDNNTILITGTARTSAEYSHSVYGEAFYRLTLDAKRLSGVADSIPVTVSERLLLDMPVEEDMRFFVRGQIRSYNQRTESGSRLIITVFAREFESAPDDAPDDNEAELTGSVCKRIIYRTTPFDREIADVLIAVNRRYGKSDYLPLIAWGRNARFLKDMPVGTELKVLGRLQSREYKKQTENGESVNRTAYEVSCSAVEPIY